MCLECGKLSHGWSCHDKTDTCRNTGQLVATLRYTARCLDGVCEIPLPENLAGPCSCTADPVAFGPIAITSHRCPIDAPPHFSSRCSSSHILCLSRDRTQTP